MVRGDRVEHIAQLDELVGERERQRIVQDLDHVQRSAKDQDQADPFAPARLGSEQPDNVRGDDQDEAGVVQELEAVEAEPAEGVAQGNEEQPEGRDAGQPGHPAQAVAARFDRRALGRGLGHCRRHSVDPGRKAAGATARYTSSTLAAIESQLGTDQAVGSALPPASRRARSATAAMIAAATSAGLELVGMSRTAPAGSSPATSRWGARSVATTPAPATDPSSRVRPNASCVDRLTKTSAARKRSSSWSWGSVPVKVIRSST